MTDFTPEPFHADPGTVMATLDRQAQELDWLSKQLVRVERDLEIAGVEYQSFVDDYEIGLFTRSQDEDGFKLPAEALRLKLAHRAMDPVVLGRYHGLMAARGRLEARIRTVVRMVDAQRSILSALKVELEATATRRAA